MKINIIAVGTIKENFLKDGITEYAKRMRDFKITEIDEGKNIAEEGKRILSKIPKKSYVIALCVEGKKHSSQEFAEILKSGAEKGEICFIIGGSDGLSDEVKEAANLRISFSDMTFPHQLMRLILSEQIYRAQNILAGGKYHK